MVSTSSYLALTNDWGSNIISATYKTCLVLMYTAATVSMVCLQIALTIQGRAILVWVKLEHRAWIHSTLIGVLLVVNVVAFAYYWVYMGWQMAWYGWTPAGIRPEDIRASLAFRLFDTGSGVTVVVDLLLWSVAIVVSTLRLIWKRRAVLFSSSLSGPMSLEMSSSTLVNEDSRRMRRTKAADAFEKTLTLIGLFAVQSFAAPGKSKLIH